MRFTLVRRWAAAAAFVPLAACAGDAARPTLPDDPVEKPPQVLGLLGVTITGIASGQIRSTVTPVPLAGNGRGSLSVVNGGMTLEGILSTFVNDGTRTNNGQRYFVVHYRFRNATGATRNNMTLLLATRANSILNTGFTSLLKSDGTPADSSIATSIIPVGAVAMASDGVSLMGLYPDVMQVLTESEVASITPPSDVTNILPVGFMVRNRDTQGRQIPATTDPNVWDGEVTVAFRVPRQPTAAQDVNSISMYFAVVEDSETRMTESMEEAFDTAAVRRLRERASFLGATTVTVLAGSPALDPAIPDYPGQRQICAPRTAGTAASPTTFMNKPASYARVAVLRPGESLSACGAYFRSGTPSAPVYETPYTLTLKAMDRYGNVRTAEADTMKLVQSSGPSVSFGAAAPLVSGSATVDATWHAGGTSVLWGVGRRLRNQRVIDVPFGDTPGGLLRSR
ncbi:MAG TPA: hypothetical protein VFJ82_15920 [Longimicrobium sp.]|nr:hypothetical protein [Longimicrobium sp.]